MRTFFDAGKSGQARSLLPFLSLIYLLPAFLWWAFLLWKKNETVFSLERELAVQSARAADAGTLTATLTDIENRRGRQRRMIVAEGLVFMALLLFGLYRIRRSFIKEIELLARQRNFQLSVTHELKSPIAAVQLALETLLRRDFSAEKTREIHHRALGDIKRLDHLVENVLFSARLEDAWQPQPEPLSMQPLIEEAAASAARHFPSANITTDMPAAPVLLSADRMGVQSVLSNLIENALKYSMPEQPPVCHIALAEVGGKVRVTIADKGIGISPDEAEKVFQKFYRVGHEITRATKGTGLGLYIVKKVMDAHQGKVQVSPNTPQGSIFLVEWKKGV